MKALDLCAGRIRAGEKSRSERSTAEITGYGSTCDAYHRVRLQENGDEPARAMALAMEDAGVNASQIDYVNLHGTSTLLNDRIETHALKFALTAARIASRCRRPNLKSAIRKARPAPPACGAAFAR